MPENKREKNMLVSCKYTIKNSQGRKTQLFLWQEFDKNNLKQFFKINNKDNRNCVYITFPIRKYKTKIF